MNHCRLKKNLQHIKIETYFDYKKFAWHYIPSKLPHFSDCCKIIKHHLLRTVGNTLLTFEQLETCIIEMEAMLNECPISPMFSDPNDILSLTPGHFLIGGPATSSNRIAAWQHAQHCWNLWHEEYLQQPMTLNKRASSTTTIQIGKLVIIKEIYLPHHYIGQ